MAIMIVVVAAWTMPQMASAENVPLPSGAGTGNGLYDYLSDMACPAAGECIATGAYHDAAGHTQALIETESAGSWTAAELGLSRLPSVNSDPGAQSTALSCASVGNCVAVGNYEDGAGNSQGLIATDTNGTWTASQLPLTDLASVFSDPGIDLNSIECPAVGTCVAVGSYRDAADHPEALIATDSNGSWTTRTADLSSLSPDSNPEASFGHVSCASPGNCVAVGGYTDSAHQNVSMIATETGGTWSMSRPDLSKLPSVSSTGTNVLRSVSCPSVGNCTAAGYYLDSSGGGGTDQPMVVSETGGSWGPSTGAQLPGNVNATTAAVHLYGLACASAGNCTAIGDYRTSSGYTEGFTLTETNGTWAAGSELSPPTDASVNPRTFLSSIACTSPGSCLVGGAYYGTGTNNEMLVAQLAAGNWSSAGIVQPTTSGAYPINDTYVACAATGGYCAVGGSSLSWAAPDNEVAFLVNGPAAATAASATIDGTSAQVSWTAPADTGGLPLIGYSITASDLTAAARGGQSVSVGAVGSATVPGLTPGDTYTFTITPTSLLGGGLTVSTAGVLVTVPPAPPTIVSFSTGQLSASLAGLLAPRGPGSRLEKLARTHGYTFKWTPLEAGTVTVRWYSRTGKIRHRRRRLIGSGTATATAATAIAVHVRLNRTGRRLVKTDRRLHRRLHVTAVVAFVSGSTTVTATHAFTLH